MSESAAPPPTGANTPFQSRDEAKKLRNLEEARKSGLIPAEKDEEGNDINPHIPQYISKAPWYLSQSAPSLKHQRGKTEEHASIHEWYVRGLEKAKPIKFEKGACGNCGARTHALKDCTERPRKKGAQWTGRDMRPDEIFVAPDMEKLGFDGKRDRWGGFDPNTYALVVRDYELAASARKRLKAQELSEQIKVSTSKRKQKRLRAKLSQLDVPDAEKRGEFDDDSDSGSDAASGGSDSDTDSEGNDDDEEAKIREFDKQSAPIATTDDRTRTTSRALRIREDTAKYLHNLDVESAFYDPKTRSMRENPFQGQESYNVDYRGDNEVRETGDSFMVKKLEVFAWQAYKHGANVNAHSMPTQLEKMYQDHLGKRRELISEKKEELLEKYGGREHLEAPKVAGFATEAYVEYAADGTPLQKQERVLVKSKFEEDVHEAGHSSVWGSYYHRETRAWGYSCCKGTVRMDPCRAVPSAV